MSLESDWRRGERLTYREVDEQLGHTPEAGTVRMSGYYDYFCNLDDEDRSKFERDFAEAGLTSPSGSIAHYSATIERHRNDDEWMMDQPSDMYERLHGMRSSLEGLEQINRLALECTLEHKNDPRRTFVAQTFYEYRRSLKRGEWPDNLAQTTNFLRYYQEKLTEEVKFEQWQPKLQAWRAEYADYVASPSARNIIGRQSAARAAYVARTVPIVIADPLNALLRREHTNAEWYGWFTPSSREISIDPFSLEASTVGYRDVPSRQHASPEARQKLNRKLKATLFHELTHAFTDMYYSRDLLENYSYDADYEEIISYQHIKQTRKLWPDFWSEGMTEKFAAYIMGAHLSPAELRAKKYDTEPNRRAAVSLQPRELLMNEKAAKVRGLTDGMAYFDNRLLIDAVFEKLDWDAAELTRRQAEILAAHAFSEVPEDDSGKRLAFITAVNRAAHPGFFMKLQHVVDLNGTNLAMDIMTDPDFDPHNPTSLPFIATKGMATEHDVEYLQSLIEEAEKKMLRYKEMSEGMNTFIVDRANEHIERMQKSLARHMLLLAAVVGQRMLLEASAPERVKPTVEDRQIIQMFGAKSHTPRLESRYKTPAELADARSAIARWLQEVEAARKTSFDD